MRRRSGLDLGLDSPSFISDIPDISPRIIMNVEALEKCGKTTWGLSAPGPIVLFNIDRGLEGVVQRFRDEGKKIIVAGMLGTAKGGRLPHYGFVKPERRKGEGAKQASYTQRVADANRPIWRQFVKDYLEALQSKVRTLVIDTGTELWLLARYAFWGAASPPGAKLTGTIKEEFSSLVTMAEEYDKNVIWLHRLRPEYADVINKQTGVKEAIKTGRMERYGHSEMGFDVQTNVRLTKERVGKKNRARTVYRATVLDCRLNAMLEGMELEDDECSFPWFASAVFGTDVEEWE